MERGPRIILAAAISTAVLRLWFGEGVPILGALIGSAIFWTGADALVNKD